MRMRAERQAAIVRGINLRPMVIEEKKRVDLLHARARNWTARDEIRDVVAVCGMQAEDLLVSHAGEIGAPSARRKRKRPRDRSQGRSLDGCGARI